MRSHVQGHVTLAYKAECDIYTVDLFIYIFELRDPEIKTKSLF